MRCSRPWRPSNTGAPGRAESITACIARQFASAICPEMCEIAHNIRRRAPLRSRSPSFEPTRIVGGTLASGACRRPTRPPSGASEQIAMTIANGHAAASSLDGRSNCPARRLPSSVTKPPYNDRAAEADARRASTKRSASLSRRSSAASSAVINAANPDAEDARPAAVGKSFSVSIRSGGNGRRPRDQASDAGVDFGILHDRAVQA